MLGHVRLDKQHAALGIEPGGKVVDDDLERTLFDIAGVGVVGGERVPVGDEVEAVIVVLEIDPVAQSSNVVAEVQFSGRTHAAKNAAFFVGCGIRHQSLKSAFNRALKKMRNGAEIVS